MNCLEVKQGQVWSMTAGPFGGRHRFTILVVNNDVASIQFERTDRVTTIHASVLRRGQRAARLELEADGSVPVPRVPQGPDPVARARERKARAIALARLGVPRAEIAQTVGVTESRVQRYISHLSNPARQVPAILSPSLVGSGALTSVGGRTGRV
jgi:hypothetical protein